MANEPVILNVYDMVREQQSPSGKWHTFLRFFPSVCVMMRLQQKKWAPQEEAGDSPVPHVRFTAGWKLEKKKTHLHCNSGNTGCFFEITPDYQSCSNFKCSLSFLGGTLFGLTVLNFVHSYIQKRPTGQECSVYSWCKKDIGSKFPVKFEYEKIRRLKRWQEDKKHSFAPSNLRDKSSLLTFWAVTVPPTQDTHVHAHTVSAKDKDPHSFIMRPLAGLNRPLCDCPTCCCHPQNYLIWIYSIFNWAIYQLNTVLFI